MKEISIILLFVLLFICTVTDIKHRLVYNKVLLPFTITGMIFCCIESNYLYIGVSVFLFFFFFFISGLGAGDKKLLSIIPLFLQDNTNIFFLSLSILYIAVYEYQKKKNIQKIAFVPYIFLSFLITIFYIWKW